VQSLNISEETPVTNDKATGARSARQRAAASDAPRTVIRGESSEEPKGDLSPVFIDWLSFSWEESASWAPMEHQIAELLSRWTGKSVHAQDNGRGIFGFKHSSSYWVSTDGTTATKIATFARGGESQKGRVFLQIDGTGCGLIRDFKEVKVLIDSIDARITRVDLAIDDYSGQLINVDQAVNWYNEGLFKNGSRNPSYSCAGDWLECQGKGRTFYVGKRANGKITRIYEKGRQLGDPSSLWTRFETEITSRDRDIPSDVLDDPTPYFAGQYVVSRSIVDSVVKKILTIKNEVQTTLEKSCKHAITQCGALVNYLAKFLMFNDSEIVSLLKKEGRTPARLSRLVHRQVDDVAQFRADILRGYAASGV
jgi:phage replication initiation protein